MSEKIVKFHKTMNKSNKIWDFCWKKKENLGLLGGEHCKIPQKDLIWSIFGTVLQKFPKF